MVFLSRQCILECKPLSIVYFHKHFSKYYSIDFHGEHTHTQTRIDPIFVPPFRDTVKALLRFEFILFKFW